MKCLIQRVSSASVTVDGAEISKINAGLLVLLGVERHDTAQSVIEAAEKVLNYRVFSDNDGKMNLSLIDCSGELLVVSQFTLAANTKKGMRPSFSSAGEPTMALDLYQQFADYCSKHVTTKTGEFGVHMQVKLINDGPVTFMLEK